jgi:phosphonate transport system permease protein
MLAFHMGLFHMSKTASILIAMFALVAIVDVLSYLVRRRLAD